MAKSAGFCWGVNRAVRKAREIAASRDRAIYTDGPLIHNEQMMEKLREDGIREAGPSPTNGETLLIRAHGVPPERRIALKQHAGELIDCTCPDVARIQGSIRKYANRGYDIVIFGDPGHAEVTGLLGFANSRGHVVESPDAVADLPELERVCLVSQSTQFTPSYNAVAEAVRRRFGEWVVLDTICDATKNRQRELLDIAEAVDAIVVVGGAHSANTIRLVELAESLKPTFHIQTPDQVERLPLSGYSQIGLTAGASTPAFILDGIRKELEGCTPPL